MKKQFIRTIAMVMAVMMSLALLVGCGKAEGNNAESTKAAESKQAETATVEQAPRPGPMEAVMMLWGDKPAGFDEVMAEFENRTGDTLNLKWNVIWTPLAEYGNKLKLKISAGEDVDSAFDAQWNQMLNFISQNGYAELDQYFNNDKYPGLKKYFNEEMINNNKFNGHVYGIPFTQSYGDVSGFYIRKDLREKYGLPVINSYTELEAFFDKVLENEQGMIPLAANGQNEVAFYGVMHNNQRLLANDNIYDTTLGAGVGAVFKLSADGKKVENVYFEGDPDKPQGVVDIDELARKWYVKGYFEKDVISQKDKTGLFKAGKAAAVAWDTANFYAVSNDLKKAVPGAEIEFFANNDAARKLEKHSRTSEFKAFNFACIPTSSQKTERVMMFFDWIFSDRANHDLFEYGIEGKNWVADDEDKYRIPEGGTPYNFPGYMLTWNPGLVRDPSDLDSEVLKFMKYKRQDDTYYKSALAGFTFNIEPVKTEMAKVGPVLEDVAKLTTIGLLDNPKEKKTEVNEKARKLGLEKIREEAKKQVDEFLASSNKS